MKQPAPSINHRSFEFPGRNDLDLREQLFAELGALDGVVVQAIDDATVLVVHRSRPRWATVAGVALLPALGIGLLLLLIRHPMTCQIRVTASARGATVTATGQLPDSVRRVVFPERAVDDAYTTDLDVGLDGGGAGRAETQPEARPSTSLIWPAPSGDQQLDVTRVESRMASPGEGEPVRRRFAGSMRISFVGPIPDVELVSGDRLVVGRDPTLSEAERRQPLDDPHRLLSKTHAALGVDENGPYVEDLNSTNGSSMSVAGRPADPIPSGMRVPILTSVAHLMFGGIECVAVIDHTNPPPSDTLDIERTVVRTERAGHRRNDGATY